MPPPPCGSYFAAGSPPTLPSPGRLRSSLLRTSRTSPRLRPENALIPSRASGVGLPSDMVEPEWLKVTYEKPAGSASTSTPRWSAVRASGP